MESHVTFTFQEPLGAVLFLSLWMHSPPPHFLRGPSFLWGLHGTRNGPSSLAWGDPTPPAVTFHIGLRVREILQKFAEISEWLIEWRWEVWSPCNHSVVPAREGVYRCDCHPHSGRHVSLCMVSLQWTVSDSRSLKKNHSRNGDDSKSLLGLLSSHWAILKWYYSLVTYLFNLALFQVTSCWCINTH